MNSMYQENYLSQFPYTDWKPHTTHPLNNPYNKPHSNYQIFHPNKRMILQNTFCDIHNMKGVNAYVEAPNIMTMPLEKEEDVFTIFNRNYNQQEQLVSISLPFQQETSFPIDASFDYSLIDPRNCFQQDFLFLDNTACMTYNEQQENEAKFQENDIACATLFNDNPYNIIEQNPEPLFHSGSSSSSSTKYCSSVNSNESVEEEENTNIQSFNVDYTQQDDSDDNSDWYQITHKRKAKSKRNNKKSTSMTPNNYHQNQGTRCSNCRTFNTPLWRRNTKGQPLCNACGLFFKLHGTVRPLSLKTDVIKKRNRTTTLKKKTNSNLYMTKNKNVLLDNITDENFDDHHHFM